MDERAAPGRPLWERLEQIRLENGWTKVRLAREAGIDRTTIDKWRHQPRAPQPPTVKLVAERLQLDQQEALTLAGITAPAAPESITEIKDGEAEAAEGRPRLSAIQGGGAEQTVDDSADTARRFVDSELARGKSAEQIASELLEEVQHLISGTGD